MLNQHTVQRLREMYLTGMADAFVAQANQADVQSLTFEERLGLLVDSEWTYRHNRKLKRLLKEAKLRLPACIEDIDYGQPRGLDKAFIRTLGAGQWISSHLNVLIEGPTGSGKTFIACALANAACRQGFSARYYRLPRLFSELPVARGDGSYPRLLSWLAKMDVLILDDWGLAPFTVAESRDILEVLEDRSQTRSTIIASQLPVDRWHNTIADPSVADAILDRLVHNAHRLTLKGESMRKVNSNLDRPSALGP